MSRNPWQWPVCIARVSDVAADPALLPYGQHACSPGCCVLRFCLTVHSSDVHMNPPCCMSSQWANLPGHAIWYIVAMLKTGPRCADSQKLICGCTPPSSAMTAAMPRSSSAARSASATTPTSPLGFATCTSLLSQTHPAFRYGGMGYVDRRGHLPSACLGSDRTFVLVLCLLSCVQFCMPKSALWVQHVGKAAS